MVFCSNCGKQIKAGIKFCPYCGAAQQQTQQKQQADQNQQMNQNQQTNQSQYSNQGQPMNSQPNAFVNKTQQFQQQFQQFQQQYSGDANNQVQLGFVGSTKYAIAHWKDFKTPESRKSIFWWAQLAIVIVSILVMIVGSFLVGFVAAIIPALGELLVLIVYVVYMVYYALASVLLLAAAVRRFLFIGKEPWLITLILVPLVQLYVIYLLVIDKPQPVQWNQQQGYPNQNMQQQYPNQNMQQHYQNPNMQQPMQSTMPNNGQQGNVGYQGQPESNMQQSVNGAQNQNPDNGNGYNNVETKE